MKNNIIYLISLICFINCYPIKGNKLVITNSNKEKFNPDRNIIDELKTTDDVIKFAKSVYPEFSKNGFGNLQIKSTDTIFKDLGNCPIFKDWNVKNWEKIDLNNDKRTDLLFTAYWHSSYSQYAIIDKGRGDYELNQLSADIENRCKIVKPIKIEGKNELLLHHFKTDSDHIRFDSIVYYEDTLTYKFDSFVEKETRKKTDYQIESIKFIFEYLFQLEINSQGQAIYEAIGNPIVNEKFENLFKGKSIKGLSINQFKELSSLLEYIRVKDLSDSYEINGMDFSTVVLEVTFKDGTSKKIRDYGFQGTFGLNSVYDKMIKIAKETNWE